MNAVKEVMLMKKWKKPSLTVLSAEFTKYGGNTTDPDGGIVHDDETNQTLLQTEPGS